MIGWSTNCHLLVWSRKASWKKQLVGLGVIMYDEEGDMLKGLNEELQNSWESSNLKFLKQTGTWIIKIACCRFQ